MPRRDRWWALGVWVALLSVYVPTVGRTLPDIDAYSATLEAWRIATAHTPWFDGFDFSQMSRVIAPQYVQIWIDHNGAGHLVSFRSPGVVLAAIPAYWLRGGTSDPTGYSLVPGGVTAALLTATAMVFFFLLVRRCLPLLASLVATAVLGLATPMWSDAAHWMFTHSLTVVGILGMAWAADRDRWRTAGLLGALGILGRLHVGAIVAVLAIGIGITRRDWRPALRIALPTVVLLAGGSLWSHHLYGRWSPSGGYDSQGILSSLWHGSTGDSPTIGHGRAADLFNQIGLWLSPGSGLLVWTPLIVVLAPALVRSWGRQPDCARLLVLGGVVYALVQGQIDGFSGGTGFWPYRLMLEPLCCFAPALAFAVPEMGPWARRLAPWVVGLMFAGTATGAMHATTVREGHEVTTWVPFTDDWHSNSYLHLLRHGDAWAWSLLGAGLVVGAVLWWLLRQGLPAHPGEEAARA